MRTLWKVARFIWPVGALVLSYTDVMLGPDESLFLDVASALGAASRQRFGKG